MLASLFSPAASAQDPVSPNIYLKTYTRTGLSDSQSTTWQDFGTQGNSYGFSHQTVNILWVWDYVGGGTNNWDQDSYITATSTDNTENQTGVMNDSYWGFGTLWSSASQLGVTTTTNAFNGDGDPIFNHTNAFVTDMNVAPPSFAWQKASISITGNTTNIASDDFGTYTNILTTATTENITTTVELSTGGYTNSTNQSVFLISAWAVDVNTGYPIDPALIQIQGTNLDASGQLQIPLNDNDYVDLTPVLPAAFSNYLFSVAAGYPPGGGPTPPGGGSNTVTIAKMQYMDPDLPGTWLDVTGTIYSYQNDTYQFRVLPSPTNATWPGGSPTWTVAGASAGTGAQITYQFSTLSSSATDYKQVVATCGTSSRTSSVVVFSASLTYGPEDNFSGRSYTQFGLGERFNATNGVLPYGLSPSSVGLDFRSNFPYQAGFSVSSDKTTAQITGVAVPGSYEIQLIWNKIPAIPPRRIGGVAANYIPPSSVEYIPVLSGQSPSVGVTVVPKSVLFHNTNSTASICELKQVVKPGNVSWESIQVREGYAQYSIEGVFTNYSVGRDHNAQALQNPSQRIPVPNSALTTYGWALPIPDGSGPPPIPPVSTNATTGLPEFQDGGRMYITIPLEYVIQTAVPPYDSWIVSLGNVYSEWKLSPSGRIDGLKQNISWSVNYWDPTTTGPPP